ncbi:MAG: hypothetical protein AABW50_05420 [Nanoarchaeota archaeon]
MNEIQIVRNGSWLRAKVKVNLNEGIGLEDSLNLKRILNKCQTYIHSGDSIFPINLGPAYLTKDRMLGIGATYQVKQGTSVEVVARTGRDSRRKIREACNYLSSNGSQRKSNLDNGLRRSLVYF